MNGDKSLLGGEVEKKTEMGSELISLPKKEWQVHVLMWVNRSVGAFLLWAVPTQEHLSPVLVG